MILLGTSSDDDVNPQPENQLEDIGLLLWSQGLTDIGLCSRAIYDCIRAFLTRPLTAPSCLQI